MDENDQRSVIEYTARLASLVAPNALEMSGKTVQFIGAEPFNVSDLEGLLPSDATVVIDGPVDEPDIVVLGTHDFDTIGHKHDHTRRNTGTFRSVDESNYSVTNNHQNVNLQRRDSP
jgi:hypothetical protein